MTEWHSTFVLKGTSKPVSPSERQTDSSITIEYSIVGTVVTLKIGAWCQGGQVSSNTWSWPLDYYEHLLFTKLAELCRSVRSLSKRLEHYTYPCGISLRQRVFVLVAPPVHRTVNRMRLWVVGTSWFLQDNAFTDTPVYERTDLATYRLFKMYSLQEEVEEFGEQLAKACTEIEAFCDTLLPPIED